MSAYASSPGTAGAQAPTLVSATRSTSARRALVVDDSEAARLILKGLLERETVEVMNAMNGDEAVEQIRQDPLGFNLIVMDLVMEGGGGIETIRRIRQLTNGADSIICPTSSTTSAALEEECRAAGASMPILLKPYDRATVRRMLVSALGLGPDLHITAPAPENRREAALFGHAPDELVGVDVEGALARCCDDAQLLRRMLESLSQAGFKRIYEVQAALYSNNLAGALLYLHNLRGEMLNLGMSRLATCVDSVEELIRTQVRLLVEGSDDPQFDKSARESVHKRLTQIGLDLASTATSMCLLPDLQPGIRIEAALHQKERALDTLGTAALVAAMRRQELSALDIVPEGFRMLPDSYSPAIEKEFRNHFESLDFPAALRLLHSGDYPEVFVDTVNERHRVLIVDDSPTTVRLLGAILQTFGSLRFALSGEQALEVARVWQPHLVLADVQMEGMSGIELCRQLKELPPTAHAAVIILSTDHDVANEVSALSAGAADFIEKPINPSRVIARVNRQLANVDRMRLSQLPMSGEGQHAPLGFITCSLSGNIIEMNPSVAKLLGRSTRSFIGQPLSALFDPPQLVSAQLTSLATTGKPISFETLLTGVQSVAIPAHIVGWTAPGVDGRVLWIVIEDLREWRLVERKRLDMKMSRQISSVTSGIAHEFNNLLTIVIGNLDLVSEGETDATRRRRLNAATKSAERAAEISRRLGDSAQSAAVRIGQPIRLQTLIEEVWPLLANSVPKKVRLARELASDLPCVLVEPLAFREALLNLIQNACDAMPSGGQVTIRVRAEPADPTASTGGTGINAVVEVIDDGTGITQAVADQAFDPFFTTRSPEHVGLGLTMVRSMVASYNGSTHIHSAPGAGAVVTMNFPTVDAVQETQGVLTNTKSFDD